jgi:HD-GYP domain-containing protein (c-di-GMP phosphodiesterase class II)
MKDSTRKLRTNRLSTKIILMVEVVLLLSGAIFCVVSIINSRVGIRKAIQQRMLDIANCASGSVNGDVLEKLTAADEGTEEYREVYNALAVFRDNVELEFVYGIKDEGGGRFTFTVDPALNDASEFGEEVMYTEALAAAAAGKASVDETPYQDAWGEFYSAYSPVFDSSGKVAGIIATDFSSEWFENQLSAQTRTTVVTYCIILLVTLLVSALLSLIAVTPFVRKQEQLADEVKRKADENEQLFLQIVRTLADAVDAKDPYTNGHSRRVSQYSVLLAEDLGWDRERVDTLRYAALLHDIGKIGVPDSILNSPKRLTTVEYDIVKAHAGMGGDILNNGIKDIVAENAARYHHEWYNGQGYPLGLKGEEIPEEARIIAVADAFDAMSSNRVYRKSCTPEHIRRELEEGKGRQFDPEMAERFIRLWDEGRLDSIIESNADETEEIPEGPSALLREVVETFVSQSTVVDKSMLAEAPEGDTDVDSIARGMEQSGSYNGALEVEYRQFVKLYEYISNLERRFSHPFKLILISLDPAPGETPSYLELEREMSFMERSISRSIRNVDILTRYRTHQFLIILFGTDLAGARIAVDRIFRDYFKMNGSSVYMPSYFIAEMDGNAATE